jgi:hypothetical protein
LERVVKLKGLKFEKGDKMEGIRLPKEVSKNFAKNQYYTEDNFCKDIEAFITAIQDGRLIAEVISVSRSGMSRSIMVEAFEGEYKNGYYRNFIGMFHTLGEKVTKEGYIKVSGCGMDMVFHLKYQTLLSFENMGNLS